MAAVIGKVGKQKNKSGAKKRIARTGSGKWKMEKAGRNHLLMQKKRGQKKMANSPLLLAKGDAKAMARTLPSY